MTAPSHNEPLPPGMLRTLLVVSFGPLLLNVAATTLNVALDGLMVRFAAPLATMQWTVTAYLLALTAKRMGRAVAILSIPVLVAPVFGPALGALVVEHLSWRWIFLMNVPLALGGAR